MTTTGSNRSRATVIAAFGVLAVLATTVGCSSSEGEPTAPSTTVSATSTSPTTSSSSRPPTSSSPEPAPQTPEQSQVETQSAAVKEGAACGPRGATALFADGTTAYCARLQYTDGAAWSRNSSLAPNPNVPQQQYGPQIGEQCIGADIGRTSTDANGNAIVCDNYAWTLNVGQEPRHPWADSQREWNDCLEANTTEVCREMLNPTG